MSKTTKFWFAMLAAWPLTAVAAPQKDDSAARPLAELPGKPTGPIAVEHHLSAPLSVGASVVVTITARAEPAARGLALETTASRPSAVLATAPVLVASGAGMASWQLSVVPLEADAGYFNVIVTAEIDGITQARTVAVALRSAAAPVATAKGDAETETLIALPVEESR
jgi:hypothetical protein